MLRIGYDAKRLFNNFTGLGNYSRTLLKNLATYYSENIYFLYTPSIVRNGETHFFLNSAMFNLSTPQKGIKSLWRSWGVKKELSKHKIQLYHGLSHEIPFGIEKTAIRTIVTIHDLVFKRYPGQYSFADRKIYDLKFRYACRHADKIVAISKSTKNDIVHFYQTDPSKIEVIYQSCHVRFVKEKLPKTLETVSKKYNLPSSYLLYVGSVVERKNLLEIVQAIEQLPEGLKLPLVVIGEGKGYMKQVRAYVNDRGLENYVLFIRSEFDDLPAIYQKAKIFIYPSRCEGFGIPVLEALFSRTPVITSKDSSLPEAGGPGSYLAAPGRPEEIAAGIRAILTDDALREKMVGKGLQYAQRFNGEALTKQMMELYEDVVF